MYILFANFKMYCLNTHSSFTDWRSKNSLATSIQLGHYDVLCLIRTCLSREVDDVWFVYIFVETIEQEILIK